MLRERLHRLIDYYLDCLKGDEGIRVIIEADELVERCAPIRWRDDRGEVVDERGVAITSNKRGNDDDVLVACWPVEVVSTSRGTKYIPVLIQSVRHDAADGTFVPDEAGPRLNPEWLRHRRFDPVDRGDRTELERELGIVDSEGDEAAQQSMPTFAEMCSTLALHDTVRSGALNGDIAGASTELPKSQGIHDVVILTRTAQSTMTKGLRRELRELRAHATEATLRSSALGLMLGDDAIVSSEASSEGPRRVTTMSRAQAHAVSHTQMEGLTVVTGPPGTGKSQVVLNIVANQMLRGETTLFASRNNKAVDVVEQRLNDLAQGPAIVRVGDRERNAAALEYVGRLLSGAAGRHDQAAARRAADEQRAKQHAADEHMRAILAAAREVEQLHADRNSHAESASDEDLSRIKELDDLPDIAPLLMLGGQVRASANATGFFAKRRSRKIARNLGDVVRTIGTSLSGLVDLPEHVGVAAERLGDWAQCIEHAQRLEPLLSAERRLRESRARRDSLPSWSEVARRFREARAQEQHATVEELQALVASPAIPSSARAEIATWRDAGVDIASGRAKGRGYYQAVESQARAFRSVLDVLKSWCVTNLSVSGRVPLEPSLFDLVVIDEASQCDVPSALPLLYRARRAVVIGDSRQLRHIANLDRREAERLLDVHELPGDESTHWRYESRSIFDVAERRQAPMTLDEHFRSHRDIISISNDEWYGGGLHVHTDHDSLRTTTAFNEGVTWIDVEGGTRRGESQRSWLCDVEADAAVEVVQRLVASAVEDDWNGSIGVVTPFAAQARLIERRLLDRFGEELAKFDFVSGTSHKLQGDERDVIVFSPCIQDGLSAGGVRFMKEQSNLLNVAITRARAHLIVVGNRDRCRQSGISALVRLAEPVATTSESKSDSIGPAELVLQQALGDAGIAAIPQASVGPYRVDLAVEQGDSRIAIEVDGWSFHTDDHGQRLMSDLTRDALLTERGWTVMRFWHDDVMDRTAQCVARVVEIARN